MKVVKNHRRSFKLSPSVRKGEEVRFQALDSNDPEWFKGASDRGVDGYFPVCWFEIDDSNHRAVALRDYDARELSVEIGRECEIIEQVGTWCLVRSLGEEGWIPLSSLGS